MKKFKIAVVGATGAVGKTILDILEKRDFPIEDILPLASSRSAGAGIEFKKEKIEVCEAKPEAFKGIDLAFFCAGSGVSKKLAPEAVKQGALVIDNSNAFRMEPEVPLVVPEVNSEDCKKHKGIISNPNCSTIQMVIVLKPIHDKAKLKRVVVSTYQAVSGTGLDAVEELKMQSQKILNGKKAEANVYPHQIAFNVLPHIDVFDETGYTLEEWKMIRETQKILGDDNIAVTATTVRVPVINCHSESINIETFEKVTPDEIRDILAKTPGIKIIDDPENLEYPLATNADGKDEVFVGRIREDFSIPNGINLWTVADNLRKGAALNAVQIAEYVIKNLSL